MCKHNHSQISCNLPHPQKHPLPNPRQSGFTLIIALVLLTTVMLIGIGLSTMANVEIHKAERKKAYTSARANARLAALKGLHQLQLTSGPDQRVTGPSAIFMEQNLESTGSDPDAADDPEEGEYHWTGVFHTQKRTWDPINKEWITTGREQNTRNGEWEFSDDDNMPNTVEKQTWLVSGNEFKDEQGNYVNPLNIKKASERITIFDGIDPTDADEDDVQVLPVPIPLDDKTKSENPSKQTRYAYFVSEEGTKAKVTIHESHEMAYSKQSGGSTGTIRDRLPLMSPRSTPASLYDEAGNLRTDEEREEATIKTITPESLKSLSNIQGDTLSHHYTTLSKGVLADVSRGGLKKDLSRGLGDQFKETLAGEVMWTAPLPERNSDGNITSTDLPKFRQKRDKNVNKRNPEQHRDFLRGPTWDIAHSWYSLYLPKPPFIAGFYGGVEDEFDPKNKKNQTRDLVGRHDDPTIYKYFENSLNRGPKSDTRHTRTPNLEPRSPGGAQAHNWIFRNTAQTTKFFNNKAFWQYSNKDGENFKIDFTKNGYPRGTQYWRNENFRHPIAPVLIEYNMEIGMFSVDATYLWDLWHNSGGDNLATQRFHCKRDNTTFFRNPVANPEDPPPVCPSCGMFDEVDFKNGWHHYIDRFGNEQRRPHTQTQREVWHLHKTKLRMEIIQYLLQDPATRGFIQNLGRPANLEGILAHRTPDFRKWMYDEHPDAAKRFYEMNDPGVNLPHYQSLFGNSDQSGYMYLDMEKTSWGLRHGNELEQTAYAIMREMFKPCLIMRPTFVYWNPYNVQLNNVRPAIFTSPGNVFSRWQDGNIHLPDAKINTSNGPLTFNFRTQHHQNAFQNPNDRAGMSDGFNWHAGLTSAFYDRYTNNFDRWYGKSVPNGYFPSSAYSRDLRPDRQPNGSFHHDRGRLHFWSNVDRRSSSSDVLKTYSFKPGEIKVFSQVSNARRWNTHDASMSPEDELGFFYSIPMNTRFMRSGEVIQDIELYAYSSDNYDKNHRHRFIWELETVMESNRDTYKQKHNHPDWMHVGRVDRLLAEPELNGTTITVGKSIDSLMPRCSQGDGSYEAYDWWGRRFPGNIAGRTWGGMRGAAPKVRGAHRVDGKRDNSTYHGPNVQNLDGYMRELINTVEIQEHNHFMLSYNFRRKASDSNPSDSINSWIHLNARAHDVIRNGETEGSPFGWEGRVLSRDETQQEVISVSQGIARWGNSFSHNGQSSMSIVDVPRQPMHSLVELTHANLGVYNMAPTFAVGNSYASPFISPDQAYATRGKYNLIQADSDQFTRENVNNEVRKFFHQFNLTLPDTSYQLNKTLFDRYFFSTIPDWPYNAQDVEFKNMQFVSRNYPPFEDFKQSFLNNYFDPDTNEPDKYLPPNPRMVYYSEDGTPPDIEELHDFDTAAKNLLIDGSFNVNSASVEAWTAILRTLQDNSLIYLHPVRGKYSKPDRVAFLRSIYPYWGTNDPWQGFTDLSEDEIEELAITIVKEVRIRGPFLSLGHFMNRSLVRPQDLDPNGVTNNPALAEHKPWFSGPIQSALDRTVNSNKLQNPDLPFSTLAGYEPQAGSHWKSTKANGAGQNQTATNFFSENTEGIPSNAGIPGWVLQSDVLRPLAPILNARSDTFTIRGYGDVKSNGRFKAKALCEMVVQRVPEYINNNAHSQGSEFLMHNKEDETWYAPDPALEPGNRDRNLLVRQSKPELVENFTLGRRYKIIQFRWL